MEGISELNAKIMFFLIIILFGVGWIMGMLILNYRNITYGREKISIRYTTHGTLIELIWTVGPALVLIAIAFPSFKLLYLMDLSL